MLTTKEIRAKMMVSVYSTLYNDSFQYGEIKKYNPTLMPEEKKKERKAPEVRYISNENLQAMPEVPFDMMWQPEEKINRTVPAKELLERLNKVQPGLKDPGRKHAQQTRPRLVMTPAIAVDDIENDETRDIITKMQYASTQHTAMEEALSLAKYKVVKAPLTGYSQSHPFTLPTKTPYVVSPEWRRETVTWDGRQLRATVDPTAEFWTKTIAGKPVRCRPCIETAQADKYRKLSKRS